MRWGPLIMLAAALFGCGGCGGASRPVAPPPSAPKVDVSQKVRTFTLKNGLRLILQEDHHAPAVAVNVWYHVGSKDDPKGRSGFAHLFEHLMFQGSRHVPAGMHQKLLDSAGAQEHNAETDLDHTGYHETVPAHQLELALWLESDRMGFLLDGLDQATMRRERDVVKNERRERYENAPYGMVQLFTRAALYPDEHPYHLATIGDPQQLDAATLEDVRAFWYRYYAPNNATLVLVGDFEEKRALELVTKYFEPIPSGKDPFATASAPQPKLAKAKTVWVEAGTERGRVSLTWPTPPIFSDTHCDLTLLADYLQAPLERELINHAKLANKIGVRHDPAQLGGWFLITVQLKPGADATQASELVRQVLSKESKSDFSLQLVAEASLRSFSRVVFALESATSRARAFNFYQHMTDDPGYAAPLLRKFESVKPEGMKHALSTMLESQPVVTVVTPTAGAPISGRLSKVVE